ncbi:MAG: 16S rRNA (guanine(527)-N(7))-methyltransferase RsmG [Cyanobacteriota bacterium]
MSHAASFPTLPALPELWQTTLGWQPTPTQQEQFQQLYAHILDGNQRLNLTRITDSEEFWEKHLWDSMSGLVGVREWGLRARDGGRGSGLEGSLEDSLAGSLESLAGSLESPPLFRLIDIGTGAGFPGIPAALTLPLAQVTLLDSTRKKLAFLETVLTHLGVKNAQTLCDRAEAVGQTPQHREQYDGALLRAVAPAAVCAEYALPLLKLGGVAVLYRGQWSEAETAALEPVLEILGGKLEAIAPFTTPISRAARHCLYLRKTAPTPAEFPRSVGVPSQKPLESAIRNLA